MKNDNYISFSDFFIKYLNNVQNRLENNEPVFYFETFAIRTLSKSLEKLRKEKGYNEKNN